MITWFRKLSKSPVAAVIIGLLVVSFAVFGLNDVFNSQGGTWVVKAGEREVSGPEYRRIFDRQLEDYRQRTGQTATLEQAVEQGAHRQLAQQLMTEAALAAWTAQAGIRPSDKLVVEQLRDEPRFFNPITGAFDQETYAQTVGQVGLTTARFEETLKDGIANQHLGAGLEAGFRVPRILTSLYAAFGLETRSASFIELTPASAGAVPAPTDAQLQAFLQENAERFRSPERRLITVVPFTAPAGAAPAPNEAELRRRFDFRKESLSQAERRSWVQIPARDQAAAGRIVAALRAGQDPQAVARSANVEAVVFDNRPRSAVADPQVAAAVFGLQPNGVAGPVRTGVGLAVVKLTGVSAGREVTFEQARPQLVAEFQREQETERTYAVVERFTEARDSGASIPDAARAVGARTVTLPAPIDAEGRFPNGQPSGVPPQALKLAFSLDSGGESDVEELRTQGPDGAPVTQYYAVRVERVFAPSLPDLASSRPQLAQLWTARETGRLLQRRADELAQRLRRGETLAAVAQSVGAPVRTASGLRRGGAEGVDPALLQRVFATQAGQGFSAPGQRGFYVGKVDQIVPAAVDGPAPRIAEGTRRQAAGDVLRDMSESARVRAVAATKAQVSEQRLAAALGIQAPAASGGAKNDAKGDAKK